MPLFTPLTVVRTNTAADNPIQFDSGRGGEGFYTPSSPYFGWQVIPHDNKWSDGSPSFMAPISHYHLLQSESFHIKSGSGYWFMRGQKIRLTAGDDITIPRFVAHRFESISNEKQEPLVILYRYDSQRWEMEERFFRNTLPYMDDCRKAGVPPSLLQLSVFLADCWMPGEILWCPGGEYVRCALNAAFMWTLAFVGIVFYGYQRSYREYYDPAISRKRIEREQKKEK
jgi:mannose-6-phosphate isomerase-like protein (cupin superfamily)